MNGLEEMDAFLANESDWEEGRRGKKSAFTLEVAKRDKISFKGIPFKLGNESQDNPSASTIEKVYFFQMFRRPELSSR